MKGKELNEMRILRIMNCVWEFAMVFCYSDGFEIWDFFMEIC
jgi:hypothetical protein